jgi:large repetitive protein
MEIILRIPSLARSLFLSLTGLLAASAAFAQSGDITTWQVDTKHTGVNANETTLNPALISVQGNFVPLFSEQVDGQVFAQPLYLSGATTSQLPGGWADGKTHNNVVFVITENATLYAFDADADSKYKPNSGNSNPIWSLHLVPSGNTTALPIPLLDIGAAADIAPIFGDTATPVIDAKNGIIYVVSALKDTANLPLSHPYEQLLWAISVKSGRPIEPSPVTINPVFNAQLQVPNTPPCVNVPPNTQNNGNCENDNEPIPSVPGEFPFYPLHEHLRSALTLDNFNGHNTLYLAYASHGDTTPYFGFIVGYDATSLQQITEFITTPDNTFESGIWMAGASPAIDPALNKMYVVTGNGANWDNKDSSNKPLNPIMGVDSQGNLFSQGTNWPMSVLAFDTTATGTVLYRNLNELVVPFSDTSVWFTPAQWDAFNVGDQDLGSGGPLLLDTPAPDGSTKQLLIVAGKGGVMFVLDRTNLGGIDLSEGSTLPGAANPSNAQSDNLKNLNVVQEINLPKNPEIFSTPAFFNNKIYFSGGSSGAQSFPVGFNQTTNNYISTTNPDASPEGPVDKDAGVFISANGTSNGIVWQSANGLRAWDASNLQKGAIFNSVGIQTDGTSNNSTCTTATFSLPIVSGGKAYFSCYQQLPDGSILPQDNKPGYLWVYGTAPTAPGVPVQVPQNVTAQADSETEITVSWTDSDNSATKPSGYAVFRATCPNCTFAQITTIDSSTTTSFVDTGLNDNLTSPQALSPNTTYSYKVFAVNNAGPSLSSNIASATTLQVFSQPGLVAYWPMDEALTQANPTASVDFTGNGHTALATQPNEIAPSPTGYIGASWKYHGTAVTDRLVVRNSPDLQFTANQSFSLVAWVFPQVTHGFSQITPVAGDQGLDGASIIVKSRDQGNEYGLWINLNGQWEARSGPLGAAGTVIPGTIAAMPGVWTQLALVQDAPNNKRYLYVNGQLAGSGPAEDASGGGDLWFGQQNFFPNGSGNETSTDGFQGFIDEVRIYNTVVTPAQLTADISDPVYLATSIQSHAGTPVGIQLFPYGPAGFPTTEARVAPNQTYTLQLNFAQPLSAAPTAVLNTQPGSTQLAQGSVQSVTLDSSGMLVTVTLANVANAQALQLHLTGLNSGASLNGSYDLPFNVLEGDIASDGVVNVADQEAITTLLASNNNNPINQITPANAQFDLNLDGVVDGKDVSLAPSLFGATLPLQADTNLALFKQTSASSSNGGNTGPMAVDNTLATRWESIQGAPADPSSLVIDLQNTANIHSIILDWENAAGADYVLQTSNDPTVFPEATTPDCSTANTKWTTVMNVMNNPGGGIKTYSGLNGSGRFVRMCGTTRTTQFGYSLFDFEVIGSFVPANTTAPVITSALAATATVGQTQPFSYTITSNQVGATFNATGLPNGLTFTGGNMITGTPTDAGTSSIALTATNSNGLTGTATLVLTVNPAPTPVITSALTATATIGQPTPFNYTITSNPAGVTFTASPLPAGLSLTGAVISGIPTGNSGTSSIMLSATSSANQTGTATLVLTINPAVVIPPPAPPTGVTPTAISASQISLSWTASTTSGVTYSIFRSTTSGFTPSTANQVPGASGLTATTFSDSGLTAATTYFYIVEAINPANTAVPTPSAQVSATTQAAAPPAPFTEVLAIDAGNLTNTPPVIAPFVLDTDFTGSTGTDTVGQTINTTGVLGAAAQSVYQTAHQGAVTYTIPSSLLTAGQTYTVVLHFAELFFNQPNQRQFNVSINGVQVLQNFDIVAEAGNANFKAVVETFPNVTPVNGQIVIAFTGGAKDQPMVNGIEIQTGGTPIPSAPTSLTAMTVSTNQINLNWTASISSGVTYNVYRSTTPGFIPTAATTPLTNVQGTSFSDTLQLTPSTQFYYVVEAVTSTGVLSPQSQHASAMTLAASSDVIAINAGGTMAVSQFLPDTDFVGGGTDSPNQPITIPAALAMSGMAAPQQVYQDARQGAVTYTIPASILTPGKTYAVVLHFAELFFTAAGDRQFNISINGVVVQPNFDIFAAAGGANFTAVVETYPNITPVNGQIVIAFTNGASDQPMVNGIEIR